MATSSAEPERTGRSSADPDASCGFAVNAPKRVPKRERPIASAIKRVRIVPDAPTSVPAMMRSVEESTYPLAATVRPVKALRSEITIGTSAPPTGSTKSTPKRSESAASTSSGVVPRAVTTQTEVPSTAASVPAMTKRPPGNTTGRVVMSSWSFIKVMIEPLNETQPTTTVKTVKITSAVVASAPRLRYSTIATRAAAPPPTPLKSATS